MEDNMRTTNDFTQEELHDYYAAQRYYYETLDDYYNWLMQMGVKANVRKNDDDNDLNPNRFLCDRVWNKRSNR